MRTRSSNGTVADGAAVLAVCAALCLGLAAPVAALGEVTNPNGVAVIVGNRSYQHERVPEVSYADRDATAFRRYVTEVLGFDPLNVIELNDATQADLESAFGNERNHEGQLWSYLDPEGGSDVVVFYSGHGVPGLNDGRGYLLPVDAHPDTADINGYPIDLLYANLGKLEEARSIAVYLDACFSGDSYRGMLVRSASPVFVSAELPETAGAKVTVLTAASGKEVASWDEQAGHGLFTNHLLDALYGKGDADGDGQVTAGEASTYLKRYMTRAARRLFRRHQNATLLGTAQAVLSSAVGGVFPARPALGGAVAEVAPDAGPDDVQRDLLLLRMKEANARNEHEKVLEYATKLTELGGEFPLEARYYRVQAYAQAGRDQEAAQDVRKYLQETGRGGEHYEEALQLLLRLTERLEAEEEDYERAKRTGTSAALGEYVTTYPKGRHAEEARRLLAEAEAREDDAAYRRAQAAGTSAAYGGYLQEYPGGRHASDARRQHAQSLAQEDDATYERAQASDTAAAYAEYLRKYPNGRHAAQARRLREQKELSPGRVFRDCDACPEMVVVPAGSYLMGSPSSEERRSENEGPQHRVSIGEPFAVGVYEATFTEWDACVRDGGCGGYRPEDRGWGGGDRPVINVSWEDAQAYVRWLSRETGQEYRLPSESEWEYMARAGTTTPFHTGRTISTEQANYDGNHTYGAGRKGRYRRQTVPVGSFAANGFGLYDMHGNVREWTHDCWNGSYRGAPTDGSAWERGECGRRVVRGGSWYNVPWYLRSAIRFRYVTGIRFDNLGFRVARTLTP